MLLPTIHFSGNCNEVIEFYKETINAKVKMIAYAKDAPEEFKNTMPPNFVMHSEIEIFGTTVALTDGCENPPSTINHTFTVIFDTSCEVTTAFNNLAKDAIINEPLAKQFFADIAGSLTDKYGVNWHLLTRTMPDPN